MPTSLLRQDSRCEGSSSMREVDLIPQSYRRERARTRWIKLIASAAAGLVVSTAAARIALDAAVNDLRARNATLEARQSTTIQEGNQLATLTADGDRYRQQLYLLKGLRSGTAATNLFRIVDEAMVGQELWFRNWQFRRAGVTNAEGQAVETGYFIVVPDGAKPAELWQVETHMTIAGQAKDHAALSEFVKRLLSQPGIETVRIRRSEQQRYEARSIVDFDVAVVINGRVLE
jgi:type IV pilus assembly PilN-like protein